MPTKAVLIDSLSEMRSFYNIALDEITRIAHL